MPENAGPARPEGLQADPDQLDRFAAELTELNCILNEIRHRIPDAAQFLSPSSDPATVRATELLAQDAHHTRDTPTPASLIALAIEGLDKQIRVAPQAARDYRTHEEESVRTIRRAGQQE